MATQKFCQRCGKPGVKVESDIQEIWQCVDHGVIYSAPLPAAPPAEEPPEVLTASAASAPAFTVKSTAGPTRTMIQPTGGPPTTPPGDPSKGTGAPPDEDEDEDEAKKKELANQSQPDRGGQQH